MGLDLAQLKYLIIEPALERLALDGDAAVNLVTGTALVETGAAYVHQLSGPALGLWSMEEATEADCWTNFIDHDAALVTRMRTLLAPGATWPQLMGNLSYAAAMCRIKYRRSPASLPAATDAVAMTQMWKAVYNTTAGSGVVNAASVAMFRQAIVA